MSVFEKYNGKRIKARHPAFSAARWWVYRRVKGHKTIHQVIPTARSKEEAELAERQLVKQLFDRSSGLADKTVTFGDFVETNYRRYVEQNNVDKGAKKLYIKLLLKHLKDQPLYTITPQDCRDCRNKLQFGKNQRNKKSLISL
jgi:hypothetical protein